MDDSPLQGVDVSLLSDDDRRREARRKLNAINAGRDARAKIAANIGSLKLLFAGDSGIGKVFYYICVYTMVLCVCVCVCVCVVCHITVSWLF